MNTLCRWILVFLLAGPGLATAQNTRYQLRIDPSANPAGVLQVDPGDVIQFTAKAFETTSAGTTVEVPITSIAWRVDPSSMGTITAQGLFTAAQQPASSLRAAVSAVATVGNMSVLGVVPIAFKTQPSADYTFSGSVRSSMGPITGAQVSVMGAANLPFMVDGKTDASGNFSIKVPAGTYIVRASAPGFLPEYFDDVATPAQATQFVTDPATLLYGNIDFMLGPGGSIRGTVTDAATTAPVEAVSVYAYSTTAGGPQGNSSSVSATTDANGNYVIDALPDGEYIVSTSHRDYYQQYYDGKASVRDATPVTITSAASISDVDFALDKRNPDPVYTISGTVRDAQGNPIASASIIGEGMNTPNMRWYSARSANDGSYTMHVPLGTFRVRCTHNGYATEYFDNVGDAAQATPITIDGTSPARTGVDFSLDMYNGAIAGIVTDANNTPVAHASVSAWVNGRPSTNAAGALFGTTRTAADGSYLIERLAPGDYVVRADAQGFIPEYFDSVTDFSQATEITVGTQIVTGIDFSLDAGGGIAGTVVNEDNNSPLANATVIVRSVGQRFERGVRTDAQGQYRIDGLPSGDYSVFAAAHRFIGKHYGAGSSNTSPGLVTVVAPAIVSGIDFALAPAPVAPRQYRGTVRSGNGVGLHTIVEAVNPTNGMIVATSTDLDGAFDFAAWDNAVIRARAVGHVGMYAGNTRNWKESQWNGAQSGMEFTLDAVTVAGLATFDGEVRDAVSGAALKNAWVFGFDATGNVYFTVTGSDGAFSIPGTPNGALDVMISEVGYESQTESAEIIDAHGSATIVAQRTAVTTADNEARLPEQPVLHQNFPNPFNPATSIAFSLPTRMQVSIQVFDLLGRHVATVLEGMRDAGQHRVLFDASRLPSGIYLYRMQTMGSVQTRRMTVTK